MRYLLLFLLSLAAMAQSNDFGGSFTLPLESAPIGYSTAARLDPVAQLQQKIDSGAVELAFDARFGYLPAVLKALSIPVSSQGLVFSKTSFQLQRISPATPRAIYFSDDAYVGWVQRGDVVEVSAVDPVRGGMFYTLDQKPAEKPKFQRRDDCLQCHASPKTTGVPGHLVRSVYASGDGYPLGTIGSFVTDHRSPFSERWGGWYVTGSHGSQRHMGNIVVKDVEHPEVLDREAGANRMTLEGLVQTEPYLAPHSDIVALMVLEHQTKMHNLITRVNYEAWGVQVTQTEMNRILGKPEDEVSDTNAKRLDRYADILARYLVFSDEVRLTAPVRGSSQFARDFAAMGPRDGKGRSLRDFDLQTRLFKYPCSYLIYSPAFDALPPMMRTRVYGRISELLTGQDRENVMAILRATKPGAELPPSGN